MVAESGVRGPRCRVTSSRLPAAVTAATTATASPPEPLLLLGWLLAITTPTPTGTGHTANVVTLCGSVWSNPATRTTSPLHTHAQLSMSSC